MNMVLIQTEGLDYVRSHYVRDRDRKPIITFTVAKCPYPGNVFAVGIAYCSEKDMPAKKIGRKIAYKRLLAMVHAARNEMLNMIRHGNTPDGKTIVTAYVGTILGFYDDNVMRYLDKEAFRRISNIMHVLDRKSRL